jgi:hypothetical protein
VLGVLLGLRDNVYTALAAKPLQIQKYGRQRRWSQSDLRETDCKDGRLIELALDRVQ